MRHNGKVPRTNDPFAKLKITHHLRRWCHLSQLHTAVPNADS